VSAVTIANQHDNLPAGNNGKPHRPASGDRHTSSALTGGVSFFPTSLFMLCMSDNINTDIDFRVNPFGYV